MSELPDNACCGPIDRRPKLSLVVSASVAPVETVDQIRASMTSVKPAVPSDDDVFDSWANDYDG